MKSRLLVLFTGDVWYVSKKMVVLSVYWEGLKTWKEIN